MSQRRQFKGSRVRSKANCPRLSVFRSNKNIFAQIIEDENGVTIVSASSLKLKRGNDLDAAKQVGHSKAVKECSFSRSTRERLRASAPVGVVFCGTWPNTAGSAHSKAIGEKYDLYRHSCFQTEVSEIRWSDEASRWIVRTSRDDRMRARFVVIRSVLKTLHQLMILFQSKSS